MQTIIIFISALWIAFCLILLVKIWIMADDLRKIKTKLGAFHDISKKSEKIKYMLFGDKEKLKEIFINDFIEGISKGKKYDFEIKELKEDLKRNFSMINEELPECFDKMNSFNAFKKYTYES